MYYKIDEKILGKVTRRISHRERQKATTKSISLQSMFI